MFGQVGEDGRGDIGRAEAEVLQIRKISEHSLQVLLLPC